MRVGDLVRYRGIGVHIGVIKKVFMSQSGLTRRVQVQWLGNKPLGMERSGGIGSYRDTELEIICE